MTGLCERGNEPLTLYSPITFYKMQNYLHMKKGCYV